MTVAADGRRRRRRQCATLPAPTHSDLLSTPLRTHRMNRAEFLWPTPPADRFNAPRWSPESVASWEGGSVTCGRVLDATVHSSRETIANGNRSKALPRQKVHCLSLTFEESRMPRHKHFKRRQKQRRPMRELTKMGQRAPAPQIVQSMGEKGLTPHFLPAESVCTYVIPIN